MEIINITIPDNLTPDQELLEIGKQLGKKMLPPSNMQKAIGCGYEIKNLKTTIHIERKATKKTIVTRECPICNMIFDQTAGSVFYHNYGGSTKTKHVCSDRCRAEYMDILSPDRCSLSRKKIKPTTRIV